MNVRPQRSFCLYVTGFDEDIERRTLKFEFSKFGNIEKLYLDNSGAFAKIFYSDKASCNRAIHALNDSPPLNWRVEHYQDNYQFDEKKFSTSVTSLGNGARKMARYGDYYETEDFVENFEYCNIHGQPLEVLQADSGDLYVNLKDIRRSGFALFRRDTFNSVLVDKRQVGKEFELHLLSEAKNYILKNRVAVIDEEQILQTIERCKSKLLGGCENKNNFGAGRSVAPSPSNNIVITSEVEEVLSNVTLPMIPQSSIQRPPKSLSSNFMPTNTQRNERFKNRSQEQQGTRMNQNNMNKDEREYKNDTDSTDNRSRNNGFVNGFDVPIESKEHKEQNLNLSNNSSDSRNSYKKSSIPRQMANNNGRQRHFREEIGNLNLEIGKIHHVQVVFNEKENIWWVQEKNQNVLEDMFVKINEVESQFETINPTVGQLVIALFEEAWNRARVINVNPLTVHFIDFGNKSQVQAVKPLPDEFRKIPALAARITPNQLPDVQDMTDVHIKVKKQYEDGTYLVDFVNTARQINFNETKAVKPTELKEADISKEQFYFEVPKPIATLQNGDKVMVIDTDTNKFLVRTRECAVKSRELTEYIKNLDKSALTLTNVKVGQLVLCSKDGLVGLYRAVVTKKESGSVVSVKYIDFPGEDDLSVKSLRNIDEYLANEPTSIILSPEYKVLNNMEEKVAEYISQICQNKDKFIVVLSGEDFDLQFDDGTLLSKKIQDIKCPTPKQTTVKPVEVKPSTTKESVQSEKKPEPQPCSATNTKVLYEDMDWVNIEPGTYTFMCYSFQDLNDITMISTTEDVITYLEEITDLEITDNAPYKPEEFEMCLVSFKGPEEENASWYRAAVLEIEDDSYFVTFVDFGNKEVVKCEDIRKFPPNLKKVPILGVNCKCVGIPDTPEVVKQLKELIREGDQVEVIVKGLSDLTYEIEIPDLYQKLKSD